MVGRRTRPGTWARTHMMSECGGPDAHPFGISPNSDSTISSGNSAAVAASCSKPSVGSVSSSSSGLPLMALIAARSGSRPSALAAILALTGSKSTNHDLKMACAMASRFWLMRQLRSILASTSSSTLTSRSRAVDGSGTGKERKSSRLSERLVVPIERERQYSRYSGDLNTQYK